MKVKNERALRRRIFKFDETPDDLEDYKKWFNTDLTNCYFAMFPRQKTCYRKGDQIFNSYGARDNRYLLTNYGFTLRQNKYNSLGFKVFLNYQEEGLQERFQKTIKIKKGKLSEPLLQYLRASLFQSYQKNNGIANNNYLDNLLVSAPADIGFEKHILQIGVNLVRDLLTKKYPT